jgi:hypothetical protein
VSEKTTRVGAIATRFRWRSTAGARIKLRDIAAAITGHTSDPGIADLSADRKITEIVAHLTDPATGDTSERAIPGIPGRTTGEALSAASEERLSA